MKRTTLILAALIILAAANAQQRTDSVHVAHYDLNLSVVDFTGYTIDGYTDLTIVAKVNNLTQMRLDLKALTTDSVFVNGAAVTFSHVGETLLVTVPAMQTGDTALVRIYYHGTPAHDNYFGGFYFNGQYAYNYGVALEATPHSYGRVWFPCLDEFTDKSSYSFHIRTENGKGDFDMNRVHCNPSTSRPGFRLVEVDKLKNAISRLIHESGLGMADFAEAEASSGKKKRPAPKPPQRATGRSFGPSYGDNAVWVAKCAAAFKIKTPEKTFFSCKTEEELLAKKDMIKQWILNSQPVMIIRQNRTMTDEESVRWPLDIAIIDGLGPDDDTFHVVFPGGRDRGQNDLRTGMVPLSKLIRRTTDAMLMFYRPADGTSRR